MNMTSLCRVLTLPRSWAPVINSKPLGRKHIQKPQLESLIWVCLKIGYIPNYSHLIGIMISKTIGFRGTQHFQTNPSVHFMISNQKEPNFAGQISRYFADFSQKLPPCCNRLHPTFHIEFYTMGS